ncbi:MAG: zf-HC2 domain-containing protein [Acidobacteriota bacterium]
MDHPDPEALARYVRGELGREESRGLERHLASCVSCQGAVDGLPMRGGVVRWGGHRFAKKEPAGEAADAGRRARARGVLRALGGVLTASSESAANRLLGQPEHRRRALIRQEEKYQTLGLCELLLAKCRAAWIDDPAESVELAKLSALVAQRLSRELYGGPNVDDVRVMAWVHLGVSFRLAGSLVDQVAEPEAPSSEGAYPTGVIGTIELLDRGWQAGPVETALRETREAFLERGMGFDAALVTLDLISASLRARNPGNVAPLAREAIGLFEVQKVETYALDAMRFLLSSAEADDGVTQELINRMAVLLHRKRNGMEEGT